MVFHVHAACAWGGGALILLGPCCWVNNTRALLESCFICHLPVEVQCWCRWLWFLPIVRSPVDSTDWYFARKFLMPATHGLNTCQKRGVFQQSADGNQEVAHPCPCRLLLLLLLELPPTPTVPDGCEARPLCVLTTVMQQLIHVLGLGW